MKTKESVRIILNLYVSIEQNLDALIFYEDFLAEDVLNSPDIPPRKEHSIDEAIMESLWFQIIMKSCGFLEEWDKFLGVQTDKESNDKLLVLKKIVAPARREISKWKGLQKFRNEIIAHNLRDSNKQYSLDKIREYDCPNTSVELFYLVAFLNVMTMVLTTNYPEEAYGAIEGAKEALIRGKDYKKETTRDLAAALERVRKAVDEQIWNVVRFDIIKHLR